MKNQIFKFVHNCLCSLDVQRCTGSKYQTNQQHVQATQEIHGGQTSLENSYGKHKIYKFLNCTCMSDIYIYIYIYIFFEYL